MTTSETVANISKAMSSVIIGHALKDAKNPHFKNDYASLESVIDASKAALMAQGIFVLQAVDGKSVTTRLQHTSGEYFESSLELLVDRQNMQGLGSAITYARRYSLAAMLNISQADDDGHAASKQDHLVPPEKSSNSALSTYDFDNYTINLGANNRMTGSKLIDHTPEWIDTCVKRTLQYHEENNKKPHKNTQEFIEMARAYLKTFPPNTNLKEEIPF